MEISLKKLQEITEQLADDVIIGDLSYGNHQFLSYEKLKGITTVLSENCRCLVLRHHEEPAVVASENNWNKESSPEMVNFSITTGTVGELKKIMQCSSPDVILAVTAPGNTGYERFRVFTCIKRLLLLKGNEKWGNKTFLTINGMGSHFSRLSKVHREFTFTGQYWDE